MFNRIGVVSFLVLGSYIGNASTQPPVKSITKKEIEFEVKNVYGINSEYAEFSPILYKSEFVFASDRIYNYNSVGEDNWSKSKHINIFKADFKENTNDSIVFTRIRLFDKQFMDDDHSGPITFSGDGQTAIYTQISHRKQKVFNSDVAKPQLFQTTLENGKWSDSKKLDFVKVNNTYGHPTLSADGKKLFFVSDEFGGKGGKDLFYTEKTASGWSLPKALNQINTSGDELFPYFLDDELYFSSNGRGGEGGLDLFMSKFENGDWTEPVNLGPTINTKFDEFGFILNPNKAAGYFSSNRENGNGEDDIYYFNRIEKVTIVDIAIAGQFTYRYIKDQTPGGIEVLLMDEEGNIVSRTVTNADGTFEFRNLNADGKYTIKVREDGEDVELTMFGDDTDAFLLANKDGEFVYRKLSAANVGTLALMDEDNIDPVTREGSLSGQFAYTRLTSNVPSGIEVFLLDDEGTIVQRTMTDANGNFVFKKLSADKNYTIKTGDLTEDVELYIYDKNELISATLAANSEGYFVYRKLKSNNSNSLETLRLDEEDLTFPEDMMMLAGEFKYRELTTPMAVVDYEILDDEYKLLVKGSTNDNSYFRHTSMPKSENLIFKIDGEKYKDDVDLILLDRNREVIIRLDKNSDGYFVYKKLSDGDNALTLEEEIVNQLKKKGLSGQFLYKKLDSDNTPMNFEIYDESGKLVKKGKTDANGVFVAEDLDKAGKYNFKLLGAGDDVTIRYWDESENKMVVVKRSKDGIFAYNYLSSGNVAINNSGEEDNDMMIRYKNGKILQNLFYADNIYKLDGMDRLKLREVVTFMEMNPQAKIVVYSHASENGDENYNMGLSERRMEEVVAYLIEKGVTADRVSGQFFGETNPLVDCSSKKCSEEEKRQNRRTEIKVVK